MRRAILCGMLLSLLAMPAWATPQRVVSLNLCTDQLAISMLPEKRLKGVSFNADDVALSLVARAAARYPAFKGSIEEMANSQPDMVLMGTGQNTRLQQWLEEKSIPVHSLGIPDSIAALQADTLALAQVLGLPEFARTLNARQNTTLERTRLPQAGMKVAVYYPRGFSDGRNTLLHDIITRMGGVNIASEQGREGMTYLSLEELVALKPEVLIIPLYDYDVTSQAEALAQHPALRGMDAHIVPLPGQYLTCPHLGLEAIVNTIAVSVRKARGGA